MQVVDSLIGAGLWIDTLLYGLISKVYALIVTLAQYQVFSQDTIGSISSRIYALTGIFMLFKITFSMITYLVNPDEFSDKSKGFGGLIRNVILSMVLIVAVPYIFNEAYYVQKMILEDGTIAKIVLTEEGDASSISFRTEGPGDKIAYTLFAQFVRPNTKITDLALNCKEIYEYENGKRKTNGKTMKGSSKYVFRKNCEDALTNLAGDNSSYMSLYARAMEFESMELLTAQDKVFTTKVSTEDISGEKYETRIISYRWPITTIVGLIVLIVLITICIDVAVRSIKLGFYQVIAPIPILGNCTPSGKKDGMLQKWAKACIATYVDLFIRLFGLFLAILLIIKLTEDNTFSGFASVVLILGALIFAKQLPKLLQDIIGLKLDDFTLNPIKKIEKDALGGKAITGAAAGAAVGTMGMLSGAGAFRTLSGAFEGAIGNKGFASAWKSTASNNDKYRKANLVDRDPVRRTFGRLGMGLSDFTGTGGELAAIERQEANVKREIDRLKAQKESTEAAIQPTKSAMARRKETYGKINEMQDRAVSKVKQGKGDAGSQYQEMMRLAEAIKNSSETTGAHSYTDVNGVRHDLWWDNATSRGLVAEQLAQDAEKFANTTGRDHYMDNVTDDGVLNNLRSEYKASADANGITTYSSASDLDKQQGDLKTENTNDGISISAREREIQDYNDQIQSANNRLRDISDEKTRVESYRVVK